MIEDGLADIDLTSDSTPAKATSFMNEDINKTPSTREEYRTPLTPGSEFFGNGSLETPRFIQNILSPIYGPTNARFLETPAPPAPPALPSLPTPPAQLIIDASQNSPLPPLTPIGDLPTTHGWFGSPETPKSEPLALASAQDPSVIVHDQARSEKHVNPTHHQIQNEENQTHAENIDKSRLALPTKGNMLAERVLEPCRSPLNALDTPRDAKMNPFSMGPISGSEMGNSMYLEKAQGRVPVKQNSMPDVRRKLFDMDDDGDHHQDHHQQFNVNSVDQSVNLEPVLIENKMISSKMTSRLVPPTPIKIPGPPNTTPGGICSIEEERSEYYSNHADSSTMTGIGRSFHSSLQASERCSDLTQEEVPQGRGDVEFKAHNTKSRSRSEEEQERPVMSERASLVLAEMRRQMSEAQSVIAKPRAPTANRTAGFQLRSKEAQVPAASKRETERPVCNCKASQCIKRYCPCFATSNFCAKGCGCRNCENTSEYSSVVGRARGVLLERDPNAFVPRIRNARRSNGRGRQTIRGCNCRKGCEKNYCICRENGLVCGVRCTCSGPKGCQNHDESKLEDVPKVVENAPRGAHSLSAFTIGGSKVHCGEQRGDKTNRLKPIRVARSDFVIHHENRQVEKDTTPLVQPSGLRKNTAALTKASELEVFGVLPTPTNPMLPENHFFFADQESRKRSMAGNSSDSVKKLKVGGAYGGILPDVQQSFSNLRRTAERYDEGQYNTPPPKTSSDSASVIGTPLVTRVLSAEDKYESESMQLRSNSKHDENSCHRGNSNSDLPRSGNSPRIPRILRFKFGSEERSSSLRR